MSTGKKMRNIFAFLARPATEAACAASVGILASPPRRALKNSLAFAQKAKGLEGSPSLSRPSGREPCPFRLANPQKRHALSFRSGASLLETVLYIGIFTVIALLTVNTALALTRAVGEIRNVRHTIRDADIAMERMIREIRAAESVDTTASILNMHPGKLVLTGTSSTITFSLLDGKQLFLKKDAGSPALLTSSSTRVTNLVFTHLIASSSEAVRIQMTMDNKNFYGTAVLRTNYK